MNSSDTKKYPSKIRKISNIDSDYHEAFDDIDNLNKQVQAMRNKIFWNRKNQTTKEFDKIEAAVSAIYLELAGKLNG